MDKQELRKEIRNRKRQFTQGQLGELSLSVISQLRKHPKVRAAHTLLLYYSLPDEVNTHEWIDELVTEGKRVLLPVVVNDKDMVIREYTGKHDLAEGSFHIMEPVGKLFAEEDYQEIEVAIIPGMSFDDDGHRLGRGKGYYDRFLAKLRGTEVDKSGTEVDKSDTEDKNLGTEVYKIGVCFGFQKLQEIPFESHDILMNEVIDS